MLLRSRMFVGFLAVVLVVSGASIPEPAPVSAKAPPGPGADGAAVVEVPRRPVPARPGLAGTGTGRPQARPARVVWPEAGSARVAVPAAGSPAVRAGETSVLVAAPQAGVGRAAGAAPSAVQVTAHDRQTVAALGGQGAAFEVTRADDAAAPGQVTVEVDVSGFAGAFGGGFESRLQLFARSRCALQRSAAAACRGAVAVPSRVNLQAHRLVAQVPVSAAGRASSDTVFVVAAAPAARIVRRSRADPGG